MDKWLFIEVQTYQSVNNMELCPKSRRKVYPWK